MGASLAFGYLKNGAFDQRALGVAHGIAGASGLGLLIGVLQGPRRGDAMGVGDFALAAAILCGAALVIGPFIVPVTKRKPRWGGLAMAIHGAAAIAGFVLYQAWRSLG